MNKINPTVRSLKRSVTSDSQIEKSFQTLKKSAILHVNVTNVELNFKKA